MYVPFDSWPDEPDESDPEAEWRRWGNPEEELPNVPEVPEPSVPQTEADAEVATAFWVSVLLTNVAVGALALGPMLIYFRGQWRLGGGLVVVGLFFLLRTYQRYEQFREKRADDGTATETVESGEDADSENRDDGSDERANAPAESSGSRDA